MNRLISHRTLPTGATGSLAVSGRLANTSGALVSALHEGREAVDSRGHVLNTLPELLQIPVHVADGAQRVIDGQVHCVHVGVSAYVGV